MYYYEYLEKMKKEQEKEKDMERLFHNNLPPVSHKRPVIGDKRYVALLGSPSHTYGNALAFIQKWILDLFPPNMFKTIHVNSKIAHRQLKSTPHEYLKKSKPMIIFRPRIPDGDDDIFLKGTPLIERQMDMYNMWGGTNLQPLIEDPKHDLRVKYQANRVCMYVDVILILSTLMQQIDFYSYIKNSTRINIPFFLHTYLESYLPEDMLAIIANLVEIPLYDENQSTKSFMEYLNGHSIDPITYKLAGSTRSREFYRLYPVNVDTLISDLNKDDGDRVGHVMNQYQITFTVRMEFWSTGFYYIFGDNLYDTKLPKFDPDSSDLIPVYTDVLLKEDLNLAPGWSLYNRASCMLDKEDDSVNFNELLNNSIRAAIDYYGKNGIPIEEFLDIKLRKQGVPIKRGRDYSIDYKTKEIHFYRADTYHTYSILICINVELINDLVKLLLKEKNEKDTKLKR